MFWFQNVAMLKNPKYGLQRIQRHVSFLTRQCYLMISFGQTENRLRDVNLRYMCWGSGPWLRLQLVHGAILRAYIDMKEIGDGNGGNYESVS